MQKKEKQPLTVNKIVNDEMLFYPEINTLAPTFTTDTYDNHLKTIKKLSLEDFRGKWVILFFYGADFTFV